MRTIGAAFIRGLVTLAPVGLTVYLIYALAVASEQMIGGVLRAVIPPAIYIPGLGLILALAGITFFGLVIRLPILNLAPRISDAIFSWIPLVKSVYTTLRDLTDFVAGSPESGKRGYPVLVRMNDDIELIGLVTDAETGLGKHAATRSLVYLPMSYQIGGYTVSIEKERLTPLDMSVDEAMKFVVTAGVQRNAPASK